MRSLANFLSILAIIGALASGTFYYLNTLEANNLAQELQTSQVQLKAESAKSANLAATNQDLQEQLEQSARSLQEARSNQLKRENQRFTEELEMRMDNEENLQRSLADLKKEMAAQKANSITLEEANAYEQKIATLESTILKLESTPVKVASPSTAEGYGNLKPGPSDANGRILTVGPQSSFVIVSLGYTSGIRLDHLLEIKREGESIAKIQISEVKENLSIARILPGSMKIDPIAGDLVVSAN
jgi:predicted RNase H-like nuclease (RuvC/YqgF family)